MIQKAAVMLEMQNEINCRVDENWLDQDRAWYRAIWIECAELMDHYGQWKWWKHSKTDMPQVILEIVDIWHFGLSMKLTTKDVISGLAEEIIEEWNSSDEKCDFLTGVEKIASEALVQNKFNVAAVKTLVLMCDADFDTLYENYIAKNVLNMFRQDHGYKNGTYKKIWNGEEDNEVLARLMLDMNVDSDSFAKEIYEVLLQNYPLTN